MLSMSGENKLLVTNEPIWSKTILNYGMMMERYPNLKEEVGSSIPGYELSSLSDGKLAR